MCSSNGDVSFDVILEEYVSLCCESDSAKTADLNLHKEMSQGRIIELKLSVPNLGHRHHDLEIQPI
jgi:hypothetical protein